jgi:hypothetical protein
MQFDVPTILGSFSYYTALIVGQDETVLAHLPCVFGLVFGAVLAYGAFRRDAALLFSMAAYILTLLPVSMLPNQRATFYAYAPQMFLILLVCVLSERAIALLPKRATLQWAAAVGVALAMMSWALSFRRSDYFGNRMTFYLNMRMESATSAAAALTLLPEIAKGAHLYVNHGDRNPWLFVSCAYFQLRQKDMTVTCVTHQPEATLRTLYAADRGPKYLLDYKEGGALTVEDVSPSAR